MTTNSSSNNKEGLFTHEEIRLKRFGGKDVFRRVSPKLNDRDVTVVPGIEIESPSEEYELVTHTILEYVGGSFEEWVNRCYAERMSQILSDDREFGSVLRDRVKRSHGIFPPP